MRILHITSTLAAGGIASSLCYALTALAELPDVQVEVATLYSTGYFGGILSRGGVATHELRMKRKYSFQAIPRLANLVRAGQYDIVHVHGWPALLFLAMVSALGASARFIYTEHNVTNRRRQRPWIHVLDRLLYTRYTRIIAVSRGVSEALATWLPETIAKTSVIYNSIEIDRFQCRKERRDQVRAELGLAQGVPTLLFVGRLEKQKGLDVCLDALGCFASKVIHPEPVLIVCGEGPLQPALRTQAGALGLGERVRFLGHRQDLPELMAAADLLVLPSRWEGCPMVILEAMAVELPIVAAATGGVPELIEDGRDARLVPPENPEALAQALGWMVDHPALVTEMASRARQRACDEFSSASAAKRLYAAYQEIGGW